MLAVSLCVSTDIVHYVLRDVHYLLGIFSSFQPGGVDYENDSVVVTFKAGFRFSTYASIPIIPDRVKESDEQFRATFELPGGYRNLNEGDPEEANITIEDVTGLTQSVCVLVCTCVFKISMTQEGTLKILSH